MQQARLAAAGVARDADDAALSLEHLLTGIGDDRQLAVAPDQASRRPIMDGEPIVAPRQAGDELVELHPPIETLDLGRPEGRSLKSRLTRSSGLRRQQDRVGRRDLLHARRQMHDLAVSVVAGEVVRHQRLDDDLAGAKADTQADGSPDGVRAPDRLRRSLADPSALRHARSAWCSAARGAPNIAMMPSPMTRLTVPSKVCTAWIIRSTRDSRIADTCSGSCPRISSREPRISANRIVTSLRSLRMISVACGRLLMRRAALAAAQERRWITLAASMAAPAQPSSARMAEVGVI